MFSGRTMTGFAGNAKIPRPGYRMKSYLMLARLPGGGMAIDAADIPEICFHCFNSGSLRKAQRRGTHHSAQINRWKTELLIPVLIVHPIGLHVMGTSDHAYAALDAWSNRAPRSPNLTTIRKDRVATPLRSAFSNSVRHLDPELVITMRNR